MKTDPRSLPFKDSRANASIPTRLVAAGFVAGRIRFVLHPFLASVGVLAFGAMMLVGEVVTPEMRPLASMQAPEALQAAAADTRFVYAVNSSVIAKYDRKTNERLAVSTGDAKHLNSAFLSDGMLYCAHSNFPQKPEQSEIKVLDPATMKLSTYKNFGASEGSLTWAVREDGVWWCTFAFYGADNAKTRLVKFDSAWREIKSWVYPAEVVKDLGNYSISGGLWQDGLLLATGHDRRVIYRLRLPERGDTLELVGLIRSPFPGQGIATDVNDRALVGIDRSRKQVIFAELPE